MARNYEVSAEIRAKDLASAEIAKVDRSLGRLGSTVAGFATGAVVAAGAAFAAFIATMRSAISAASEAEDATTRLQNALSPLGSAAADVVAQLEAQAAALQRTTRYDDDAIKSGQALLASYIKNTDALKAATQASVDFATRTGSLESAFSLIAKAAAGNTDALSRYGLVLDEGIPKSERFAAVIAKISETFGGRAVADAQTYSGAITQLGNAVGEAQEALGKGVVENEAFRASIQETTRNVELATPAIERLGLTIGSLVGSAAAATTGYLQALAANLVNLIDGNNRAADSTKRLGDETEAAAPKLDKFAAAIERTNRIERENTEAAEGFAEAVKAIGVTLEGTANAAIQRNTDLLAQAEELYRRGVITRRDFETVERAVGQAIDETRAKLEAQGSAFGDAADSTSAYLAALGRVAQGATAARDAVGALTDSLTDPTLGGGGETLFNHLQGASGGAGDVTIRNIINSGRVVNPAGASGLLVLPNGRIVTTLGSVYGGINSLGNAPG